MTKILYNTVTPHILKETLDDLADSVGQRSDCIKRAI